MAHAGEGKPEAKDAEESPEPLNCKTWVLRVSLHCEGCKKKVHKILRRIEGVYRADIDLKQQRVIVRGNVEAETVIARLEKKTGKRPLLLLPDNKAPAKAAPKEKKQSKPNKPKENQHSSNDGNGGGEGEGPKDEGKPEKKTESHSQGPEKARGAGEDASSSGENGAGDSKKAGGDGEVAKEEKEKKPEEAKQEAAGPAGDQPAVPDKVAVAEKAGELEKRGGGASGKKKKSKGQNGNSEHAKEGKMGQEGSTEDAPVSSERSSGPGPSPVRGPSRDPASHFPPHQQFDAYPHPSPYPPPYYHGPPMYAVSYHNAYPTTSYGAAYYAPQPPPNSYTYVHPGPEIDRVPPYSDPYSHQPSDSFGLFSDENPNACSVM